MTIRIRSQIRSSKRASGTSWFVTTTAHDLDAPPRLSHVLGTFAMSDTFSDALTKAAEQRRDLDNELMNEVHASQSKRREARAAQLAAEDAPDPICTKRCGGCRDLGPHRNVPACEFYEPPAPIPATDHIAVTEATA